MNCLAPLDLQSLPPCVSRPLFRHFLTAAIQAHVLMDGLGLDIQLASGVLHRNRPTLHDFGLVWGYSTLFTNGQPMYCQLQTDETLFSPHAATVSRLRINSDQSWPLRDWIEAGSKP